MSLLLSFLAALTPIPVHGHRGTRGTRPENTLPAFQEAVAVGADFLEMDLHLSADGVLIVSHDPELTPQLCRDPQGEVLPAPLKIRELTAAQIAAYDCGSVYNAQFPRQVLQPHTPKPTFEEVLSWVAANAPEHVQLNLETKMDQDDADPDPSEFVNKITLALEAHHLRERAVLESFDARTLRAAQAIGNWRTSALFDFVGDFCAEAAKLGATYASPEYHFVTARKVADCHAKGIGVLPWTVDDPKVWPTLIKAQVDGIITDYPADLLKLEGR